MSPKKRKYNKFGGQYRPFDAEEIACPLCRVYWETRHDFKKVRGMMRVIRGPKGRLRGDNTIPVGLWDEMTAAVKGLQVAATTMLNTHLRCRECGILLGRGHGEDYWRRDDGRLVCCECEEGPPARVRLCP